MVRIRRFLGGGMEMEKPLMLRDTPGWKAIMEGGKPESFPPKLGAAAQAAHNKLVQLQGGKKRERK